MHKLDVEIAESGDGDLGDELREGVEFILGSFPGIGTEPCLEHGIEEFYSHMIGVGRPACVRESPGKSREAELLFDELEFKGGD